MGAISLLFVLLVTLISICTCNVGSAEMAVVFVPGQPFPELDAKSLGLTLESMEKVRLEYTAHGQEHQCSSLRIVGTTLRCENMVPTFWSSGFRVYASFQPEDQIHVGYVLTMEASDSEDATLFSSTHLGSVPSSHTAFIEWANSDEMDLSTGKQLAKQRADDLLRLATTDPETACFLRLPARLRRVLPAEVLQLCEEPIDTYASLPQVVGDNFDTGAHIVYNMLQLESDFLMYHRLADGHRSKILAHHSVPVWGFLIKDSATSQRYAVISRSAAREAEPDEFPAVDPSRITVVAGVPVLLPYHITASQLGLNIAARDAEDLSKGGTASRSSRRRNVLTRILPATDLFPVKTMLFVACNTPNNPTAFNDSFVSGVVTRVAERLRNDTCGQIERFDLTIRIITLPNPASSYPDYQDIEQDARLNTTDLVWESFNYWVVAFPSPGPYLMSALGVGNLRRAGMWLQSTTVSVMYHELGHNWGLGHSLSFDTSDTGLTMGAFPQIGYTRDMMSPTTGCPSCAAFALNVAQKDYVKFLPQSYITYASLSAIYNLWPHDTFTYGSSSEPLAIQLPRLVKPSTFSYRVFVEYRQISQPVGITINLQPFDANNPLDGTILLQSRPLLAYFQQSTPPDNAYILLPGSSFIDIPSSIIVTNIGSSSAIVPASLDIQTSIDPDNRAPFVTSLLGPDVLDVNVQAWFNVSATDPDGNTLYYTWFVNNKRSPANADAAEVLLRFSTAGNYTVRVEVNDARGGVTSQLLLLRVGNTASSIISGSVRDAYTNQPIANARVTFGGYFDPQLDISSSDGRYAIMKADTVSNTLVAVSASHSSCSPNFVNPIPSGASRVGRNFTCIPKPVVSISSTVSEMMNDTSGALQLSLASVMPNNVSVSIECRVGANRVVSLNNVTINGNLQMTVTILAGTTNLTLPLHHRRVGAALNTLYLICSLPLSTAMRVGPPVSIKLLGGSPRPLNDDFVNAFELVGLNNTFSGDIAFASLEEEEQFRDVTRTVWFRWTAPSTTVIHASARPASASCSVQVYDGDALVNLRRLSLLGPLRIGFPTYSGCLEGRTYYIRATCNVPDGVTSFPYTLNVVTESAFLSAAPIRPPTTPPATSPTNPPQTSTSPVETPAAAPVSAPIAAPSLSAPVVAPIEQRETPTDTPTSSPASFRAPEESTRAPVGTPYIAPTSSPTTLSSVPRTASASPQDSREIISSALSSSNLSFLLPFAAWCVHMLTVSSR